MIVGGKKIGRNADCPCGKTKDNGTPVKFKKCCGKLGGKPVIPNEWDYKKIWEIVGKKDIEKERVFDLSRHPRGEVKIMSRWNMLDNPKWIPEGKEPIVPRIKKFMDETIFPIWSNCFFNAHALALYEGFEDVEPVCGWYGNSINDYWVNQYESGNTDSWEDWDDEGRKWYLGKIWDFKTKISWTRHSWNVVKNHSTKHGDVYFDLGADLFKDSNINRTSKYDTRTNWFYYHKIYTPDTYKKYLDYTGRVRKDKKSIDQFLLWAKTHGFTNFYNKKWDNSIKEFGIREGTDKWNEEIKQTFWEVAKTDHPNLAQKEWTMGQEEKDQLALELLMIRSYKTQSSDDHKTLSKHLSGYRWDIYNPTHQAYPSWVQYNR